MLCLTRKLGQRVVIGDSIARTLNTPITITLLELRGDRCRLGIECPREIPIAREELLQKGGDNATT